MIHSFKFKNFCSFKDEAVLSFRVGNNKPAGSMYAQGLGGCTLNKVMTIIGPNASGKTSVLKAMALLKWLIQHSFSKMENENESIPLDIFRFTDDISDQCEFKVEFEISNTLYRYEIILTNHAILSENLYQKTGATFNYLFKRTLDPATGTSIIKQQSGLGLEIKVAQNILRKNSTLLSVAAALKNESLTRITEFWDGVNINVIRLGKVWHTKELAQKQLFNAAEAYHKDKHIFEFAKTVISDLDLGLSDIRIKKLLHNDMEKNETFFLPLGVHRVNNHDYELPMVFESSGTQNLFILLQTIIPVLNTGGVAVIDEMEVDLHPHMIPKIVQLFFDPIINRFNSQLLFSCHSLEILHHLEKYQIYLVEKDDKCRSELYRLDEVKGIRTVDNIYAKYNAGAYGAVPNV